MSASRADRDHGVGAIRRRRGRRPSVVLRTAAIGSAVVFALPGAYVVWRTLTLGVEPGTLAEEIVEPLWRTLQLAVLVSISVGFVGTALAWLLVRTDLPFAGLWRVLVPLPLVFPSFVGAAAFLAGLAPGGVVRELLALVGYDAPPRFRGLGASWFVLSLFTFPYVFLPVAARLTALPPSWVESARLLGDGPWRTFRRVVLPALRPTVLGGMLLVFLYCLSEFGAVQLLGYDTLTRVVYATRLLDRATSFAAATVLLALALVAVAGERRLRGGTPAGRAPAAGRRNRPIRLGAWMVPALVAVAGLLFVALVVPVVALGQWAWRGLAREGSPLRALQVELADLARPTWTTAWLGIVAGALAVAFVLPVALLAARYRSRLGGLANLTVVGGFALPGVVIALGLAFWSLNVPPFDRLYQTVSLLLVAYVVHFGAQAMRAAEVAIGAVPDRLRESAQLLGAAAPRRVRTVELPLMRPGLLAGGGLVLLSTVKELPATLLLAPIGMETLSTTVWSSFEEGFLAEAGLAAIVLVAVSGVLTWLLVLRRAHHLA